MTAVPIQHWGRRGVFDKNACLWAGYVVTDKGEGEKDQGKKRTCFFAGDTGYCPAFKEIGQVCGCAGVCAGSCVCVA